MTGNVGTTNCLVKAWILVPFRIIVKDERFLTRPGNKDGRLEEDRKICKYEQV